VAPGRNSLPPPRARDGELIRSVLKTTIGGLEVGRIGLGCFALSGGYGPVEGDAGIRTIRGALDAGVNLFDTSDAYAAGENERLVGRALSGRRHEAVVVTKFGWVLDGSGRPLRRDGSPAHVRAACEASLRRLGTDRIDVYIQHRVDPSVPIEETMGELARLRDEGKILAAGLSEAALATIRRAKETFPIATLQTEYSLWSRDPETELLPACRDLDIAFMAYSPLGRGFLTGAIRSVSDLAEDDFRRGNPRFQAEALRSNAPLVDRLAELAFSLDSTPSQVALAWLLAQAGNVIPIPSTRSLDHLLENLKAMELQLSPANLKAAANAVAPELVRGDRHPAEHQSTLNC
jgi:aryl-alcohol dehydrogenase-like predicted oxidoreductase